MPWVFILNVSCIIVEINRGHLFLLWKNTNGSMKEKKRVAFTHTLNAQGIDSETSPKIVSNVEKTVGKLCDYFHFLWKKHNRSMDKVLASNAEYFNKPLKLNVDVHSFSTTTKTGRKPIAFETSNVVSKRRKTAAIRKNYQVTELSFATEMKLRETNQTDAAKLLQEATQTTPSRATKIRDSWRKATEKPVNSYSDLEALALIVDNNFSTKQYKKLQLGAKKRNANIYPPYSKVLEAKKRCYPSDDFITVTDTEIDVKLQQLLDITAARIIEANESKLANFTDEELLNIEMIVKYGMDGSTGNPQYHQKFENDDGSKSDASIFMSSLVPIKAGTKNKVLFQNPRPSSTRLCRPIHIQLASETTELAIREKNYLENQIRNLEPTQITWNERKILISYNMLLTMVDGKICSSLTETSSAARCYICKAKPTQMNNLKVVQQLDSNSFQFGLSTLHAWIRFMEYFLKVAYRLKIKKWAPREADRQEMLKRKKEIQRQFKVELGLHVDTPRAGGSGTSNTGNVARRFFKNAEKVASITELNLSVIQRCGSILQVLASGRKVNSAAFGAYCEETARLCIKLYPWYYLPASVHKILIHGSIVMDNFLVPIGQLSEEAQEAKNKEWKR